MTLLSRFRLRTKLGLLIGLYILTIVASTAIAATLVRQRMIEERIDKLHAIVDSAVGLANALEQRVIAGQLTREQALNAMRDDVHAMRFDGGTGYVYAQTLDNIFVFHGATPALEGKASPATDQHGRSLTDLIRDALARADTGVVSYAFPKPGETTPRPKIAYVERFAPWNLVFASGTYLDDMDATLRGTIVRLGTFSGAILLVTLLVAWLINRDIAGSLRRLQSAMRTLATGDLTTTIPGVDRRDEVGSMAQAALVFKDHMAAENRLAAAQVAEQQRAAAEKRAALVTMAERIEADSIAALQQVGARTAAMTTVAQEMRASATRTDESGSAASAASAHALETAQTVANAAEQLCGSIREIGSQAAHSAEVVARAVTAGSETRTTMEALNEEVARIGSVADMISDIAAKTNLLALNATIEAARAGEAGKGFAVVASEVKALANQTARSTEEITRHIGQVRGATDASVAAVARIEQTIGEINEIASSIAASVEEQAAATTQITRNVEQTAAAANEMTRRTREVSAEAMQTGVHADDVRDNAKALDDAVAELRHTVIRVVRGSSAEVDRRTAARQAVDLPCRLTIAGRTSDARLVDIGKGGAQIRGAPSVRTGERGTLHVDAWDTPLLFGVRECEGDALHVSFALDAATAASLNAALERLSRRRAV